MKLESSARDIKKRVDRKPELSVIIPCKNESFNIGSVISEINEALLDFSQRYEIIVVDDGSYDMTGEIAKFHGANVISNRVIERMGKGYALRTAFERAGGEVIVTIDADGGHDPSEISKLITPIMRKEADLVIGSRFSRYANIRPYSIAPWKRIANRVFNLLIRIITGTKCSDSQSGFRAYRRNVLKNLRIVSGGYEIETEILYKSLKAGYICKEVPITLRTRKSRYGPNFLESLRIFDKTLNFRFRGL